jgi:hypothetical protein
LLAARGEARRAGHRAPRSPELLDEYRKKGGDWQRYEHDFLDLMRSRKIEQSVPKDLVSDACLLCSEDKPHHCHRRLVAEYLQREWGDVDISHL